jgi:hypothetical protein
MAKATPDTMAEATPETTPEATAKTAGEAVAKATVKMMESLHDDDRRREAEEPRRTFPIGKEVGIEVVGRVLVAIGVGRGGRRRDLVNLLRAIRVGLWVTMVGRGGSASTLMELCQRSGRSPSTRLIPVFDGMTSRAEQIELNHRL